MGWHMDNKCGFQNTNNMRERESGAEASESDGVAWTINVASKTQTREREGWGKEKQGEGLGEKRGGGKRAAEAAPLGRGMPLTERGKALTLEIGESFSL
jgi:hypothetical protein